MSGTSPTIPTATASSGASLLGGAKGIIVIIAAVVVVASGVGVGIWKFAFPDPKLQVVQRNVTYTFPAGVGKKTLIASCLSNETLLSGGFSLPGGYVTLSDKLPGAQAWQVDGATTDGATTMTAYATCINGKLDTYFLNYQESQYKQDTIALSPGGVGYQRSNNTEKFPGCPGGDLSTGVGFMLLSHKVGDTIPVPFRNTVPLSGSNTWYWELNPATTRLSSPYPPGAYTFAYVHTLCVKQLYNTVWQEKTFAAPAQAATTFSLGCPKDKLLVGGGYFFSDSHAEGSNNNDFYDGWLYASHSAPAAAGTPSGRVAKTWHVTAVNNEPGGNALLYNSIWWHQEKNSDGDVIGSAFYPDHVAHNSDDQVLYALRSPDTRKLTMRVLCATSTVSPTSPAKPLGPLPTIQAPVITPLPTATATPASTPTPRPTATAAAAPTPTLSVSPTQTTGFCVNGQWDNKLTITNTGDGTLTWSISSTLPSGISASPASGALGAGASQSVSLSGNAPVQQFQITFSSNGGSKTATIICQ